MQFVLRYGTFFALVLLCLFFSVVTYKQQYPNGEAAATRLAQQLVEQYANGGAVLIAVRDVDEDKKFAQRLSERLQASQWTVTSTVQGTPRDARRELVRLDQQDQTIDLIAVNHFTGLWQLFNNVESKFPHLAGVRIVEPESYRWPDFLMTSNLLNVANQISIIAILAVGMTLVIVAGGIDLSVGSLIALAAICSTYVIREYAGAREATAAGMILACLFGIFVCGLMGAFSGTMVISFAVPPFIVTLAVMLIARGLADIIAQNNTIYELPDSFTWLGRNADLFGVPNTVVLMFILYAIGHFMMSKTILGRHIYAVGGNRKAAWLSGVPVKSVMLFTYVSSGLLAGLGGVCMASSYQSGSPKYGIMYELYVIAAVVVGGTSLSGGRGSMFGTLVGALIIAVIQNGMNLTNVGSNTQRVILGLVILAAVLLDKLKQRRSGHLEN